MSSRERQRVGSRQPDTGRTDSRHDPTQLSRARPTRVYSIHLTGTLSGTARTRLTTHCTQHHHQCTTHSSTQCSSCCSLFGLIFKAVSVRSLRGFKIRKGEGARHKRTRGRTRGEETFIEKRAKPKGRATRNTSLSPDPRPHSARTRAPQPLNPQTAHRPGGGSGPGPRATHPITRAACLSAVPDPLCVRVNQRERCYLDKQSRKACQEQAEDSPARQPPSPASAKAQGQARPRPAAHSQTLACPVRTSALCRARLHLLASCASLVRRSTRAGHCAEQQAHLSTKLAKHQAPSSPSIKRQARQAPQARGARRARSSSSTRFVKRQLRRA